MLQDTDAVRLCAAIYDPAFTGWERIWTGSDTNGIYAAIKDNAIIFRGSITMQDWFRDFCAFPRTAKVHPQLGEVHEGFDDGMDEFFEKAAAYLGDNPVIAGHSLGAARAWLFAGRLIAAGRSPGRITVFGSPRPGFQRLKSIVAPFPKASYRNRYDPVAAVPLTVFPEFGYLDMADFRQLNMPPNDIIFDSDPSPWLDFETLEEEVTLADHHIELYEQGYKNALDLRGGVWP